MPAKRKFRKKKTAKGKRTLSVFIIVILLIIAAIAVMYFSWKKSIDTFNIGYTHEIQTSKGKVSYSTIGDGAVILLIHGEGTGLMDILKYKEIAAAGYKIICPSRPGYPGTSIELGKTPEEQSEVILSFLKALDINTPVIVITESLGGPVALTFCRRFPDRVKAFITFDALASPLKHDLDYTFNSSLSIGGKEYPGIFNNFLSYYYAKLRPSYTFQKFLKNQTTFNADECEKYAANIMIHGNEKDKFYTFLKTTLPSKSRADGLENDIIVARGFKPAGLTLISSPVYVFQTDNSSLIPVKNGTNISKPINNSILYTYKGNGSLFWIGTEWEDIKVRILSFLKESIATSKKETGIFSTWISMDDGTMLTFRNDGTFVVEFPSVENNKTWNGKYTFEDERILIYFTENDSICNMKIGEYVLTFPDKNLVLKEKKDKCKTRRKKLEGSWFRL
ncbi:alpha/beta hydrolase [Bacteroidota bacterium]